MKGKENERNAGRGLGSCRPCWECWLRPPPMREVGRSRNMPVHPLARFRAHKCAETRTSAVHKCGPGPVSTEGGERV